MRYREATLDDLPSICRLGNELNMMHHDAFPEVFAAAGPELRDEEHWKKSIASDTANTFVAEDTHVVGFLTVQIRDETHSLLQPARIGSVGSVAVSLEHRSQGVGRHLMELAESWVMLQGGSELRLNVWAFNQRAVRFYEELGYEVRSYVMAKRPKREA
jgi:ribosomal protein S18 acetylase RimI-like enzyme